MIFVLHLSHTFLFRRNTLNICTLPNRFNLEQVMMHLAL